MSAVLPARLLTPSPIPRTVLFPAALWSKYVEKNLQATKQPRELRASSRARRSALVPKFFLRWILWTEYFPMVKDLPDERRLARPAADSQKIIIKLPYDSKSATSNEMVGHF